MSATFRGHGFGEKADGGSFPAWQRRAKIATLAIPGGNADVVQRFGRSSDTRTIGAVCSAAQLAALYGDVGQSGSLVTAYDTRTAVLESIGDVREVFASGVYTCSLSFIAA